MSNIKVTTPSYDFLYNFDEFNSESTLDVQSTTSIGSMAKGSVKSFDVEVSMNQSVELKLKTKMKFHFMLATLQINSYYSSVDEANTEISKSAQALLKRNDLPGFFDACGSGYVRGITRTSRYSSMFTLMSADIEAAMKVAFALKAEISAMKFAGGVGISQSTSMSATSKNVNITVRSWATGLGKQEDAKLVATTGAEFKEAVRHAFLSMQDPMTGHVQSIEIIPWVENTGFQEQVNITGKDIVSGKMVPMYRKKDILMTNAEFMARIKRAARAKESIYYKGIICDNFIKSKYYNKGEFQDQFRSLSIENHRSNFLPTMFLGDIVDVLEYEMQSQYTNYTQFAFGGQPGAGGGQSGGDTPQQPIRGEPSVSSCLDNLLGDPATYNVGLLMRATDGQEVEGKQSKGESALSKIALEKLSGGSGRNLYLTYYHNFMECTGLIEKMVPQNSAVIDDYCLPETRAEKEAQGRMQQF